MNIKTPIFIVGAGRSGSTVFHRVLTRHPEVAWMAGRISSKYPNRPEMNHRFLKLIDVPIIGNELMNRVRPGECYSFWENCFRGFSEPCRDLLATDVTQKSKSKIINALCKVPTHKRHRLILKITGWSRIGFLKEIFDDAKFIHVVRDGRAVANSLINVDFWHGWKGPSNWRWGELTSSLHDEWYQSNRSFLVLAAIQWKLMVDSVESAREQLAEHDFMEVKYEDFCRNPGKIYREIQEFCNLSNSPAFDSFVQNYSWQGANDKWKEQLTSLQHSQLDNVLQSYLNRYDY